MRVWVIMGNDYPDAVFSNKRVADAYVTRRKADNELAIKHSGGRKVYWRANEFELQDKLPPKVRRKRR